MRYIIIATHGRFAEGIIDSLDIIIGTTEQVIPFCAFVKQDENLAYAVETLLNSFNEEDEIIILADLFGGSVCNEFMRHLNKKNLYVLAGVNLMLLLDLVTNMEKPLAEALEQGLESSRESVVYCNKVLLESGGNGNIPDSQF